MEGKYVAELIDLRRQQIVENEVEREVATRLGYTDIAYLRAEKIAELNKEIETLENEHKELYFK